VIETSLILIDGIAGTGKTTLSRNLGRTIDRGPGNAIVYEEFTRPHPIHEWEIPDLETWERKTTENWRTLSRELSRAHSLGIVESSLFQGTVGELLERDVEEGVILDYALRVPSLVRASSPVLIYLAPDEVRVHIERTYAQRAGRWQAKIDGFAQNTAWGRARRLSGLEGYIAFLETLKRLSDSLFEDYEMRKLRVDISHCGRDRAERLVRSFLDLPGKESP
jgi:hypothetical protein